MTPEGTKAVRDDDDEPSVLGAGCGTQDAARLNEQRYLLIETPLTDRPGYAGVQRSGSIAAVLELLHGCVGPDQIRATIDAALAQGDTWEGT